MEDIDKELKSIFDELDDEFLTSVATYYPKELRVICLMATLDYQILVEQKENDNKG